jgi:hypothetical protein
VPHFLPSGKKEVGRREDGAASVSACDRRAPLLALELLAGAQEQGEVLLLPGEGLMMMRIARLLLPELPRVVDGASGTVGDSPR